MSEFNSAIPVRPSSGDQFAFNEIFKLPYITRPLIILESFQCSG